MKKKIKHLYKQLYFLNRKLFKLFKVDLSDDGLLNDFFKDFVKGNIDDQIKKSRKLFLDSQTKLNDLNYKELPHFYSVNASLLSSNLLQKDKYLENHFSYYFTEHRKTIYDEIQKVPKGTLKVVLNGIQDSGKSFFLSDYVLRQRFFGKESNSRITYINNSEEFVKDQTMYIMRELIYALCLDLEEENELKDLEYPPIIDKNIKTKNQITHWLHYLDKDFDVEPLKKFLIAIKEYLNKKGIKVVLVWDQINVLFRLGSLESFKELFKTLCSYIYFDLILVSASNNNQQIYDIVRKDDHVLNVNPFEIFNEDELKKLISLDCETYHPKNFKDVVSYTNKVFELVQGSLSEYHHFKKAWYWGDFKCDISLNTYEEIKEEYKNSRYRFISESEQKFQQEKIHNSAELEDYINCLRKFRVYKKYREITDKDEMVFNNIFEN